MNKNMLPDFYGILEVQHYIKGRLRLKVNILIGDEEKAKSLIEKFSTFDGIEDMTVNTLIGSVLIKFSEELIDPITLMGAVLNVLGLEDEVFEKKNGKIFSFMNEMLESIDFMIYNKTKGILDLKTSIALLFIIYGIRKIRQNPIMPNGVNLLWWGYNIISKGGK